jgi:RNA polymerase sigma factor (sigma-70 family)
MELNSASIFYRKLGVLPAFSRRAERETQEALEEARLGLLRAVFSLPSGRALALGSLEALASGARTEPAILDGRYWDIDDGMLPGDRRDGVIALHRRLTLALPCRTVLGIARFDWVAVERICRQSAAACDNPSDPACGEGAGRAARALADHDRALGRMVENNIGLVLKMVRRFRNLAPLDEMDLVQAGCEGLIAAVRRFDPYRGFRFSTYAMCWIRQGIFNSVIQQRTAVSIPRHAFFESGGETSPSTAVMGEVSAFDDCDVTASSHAGAQSTGRGDAEGSATGQNFWTAPDPGPFEDGAFSEERIRRVRGALAVLSPRDRHVVLMRFGLGGGEPMTLTDIGRHLGVSRERARQIESRALSRLRSLGSLEPE